MRDEPAVWGGIECTLNRVGDRHRSQLARNGHLDRIEDDLDAFASLGLAAIRYPVLWDQVEAPTGHRDFTSADRAMSHLSAGTMTPIVGLLHHGSGPLSTSLVDPAFPEKFADFAGAVARRYPWVTAYTPINEPLTTARFAGLYGHWYPHASDDRVFVTMLLNQARATALAMAAIRAVNPDACLIQTEDLGRASGSSSLGSQIAFENDRRWLSFDLLCGRVGRDHPLHAYITGAGGADVRIVDELVHERCEPDVVGINHYPRSNRWLDDRLELFDGTHHGGNGSVRYADVAASDTPVAEPVTLTSVLDEAWARYGIPLALTEVHVSDDSAARISWWLHAVESARAARRSGADVRAVTTWSLLGSYDWDTLCTSDRADPTYERGAFDVSSGVRVETDLTSAIRITARSGEQSARPRPLEAQLIVAT